MARKPVSDSLLARLRGGDPVALGEFLHRYRPQLEHVVSGVIEPGLLRRFGPESVALSACRTFARRAREGQFEIADGDALWALLCVIAMTKARERARFHLREKRDVNRETHSDADGEALAPRVPDRSPGPAEAAAFADELEHLLSGCSEKERAVLELRLEQRTQQEIGETLRCTKRTVRRLLRRVEDRLRKLLDA